MTTPQYQEHPICWTRELSSRFWDFYSRKPTLTYFSAEVSNGIINNVLRNGVPLRGKVLDFGCGRGDLLQNLTNRRIACEGADFSPESAREVERKLRGNPYFRGVTIIDGIPTQLPGNSVDVLFCIETVEHILDDELLPSMQEIHRLLRSGGYLIVTTPNDEDLDKNKILCPECGCIYHTVQHVRSWSKDSLEAYLSPLGFKTIYCGATVFDNSRTWSLLLRIAFHLRHRTLPHLIYIGQKI
ncbi:MAG TPA: class I SAM-dependent methyltransferase [Pirellulales bacterium]|jgi:SAM-dependent methyltransferase|nr:class I SAM-dependent methyltransferase [Pirellulales bacterium]